MALHLWCSNVIIVNTDFFFPSKTIFLDDDILMIKASK